MLKPLIMWTTTNCGKFFKRWEYQTTLPASRETCMWAKKQQLEPDIEQRASSKLGKECIKDVYCHLACLTSMQSENESVSHIVISDSLQPMNCSLPGSSVFSKSSSKIWKLLVHILLKCGLENFEHYFASMWDECKYVVVWTFFVIAFLWEIGRASCRERV